MASTQDSAKNRLTSRQRESAERRIRMTQRRQELTSRIRKQKKSKYLQKKRSLPCGASADQSVTSANPAIMTGEVKALLESYCQNRVSLEQLLSSLQHFVSNTNNNAFGIYSSIPKPDNPLVILEQSDESIAAKFLDCLRQQTSESFANLETLSFQITLRILVHLTSISSGDSSTTTSTTMEYYGRRPSTWSELLVSPFSLSTSPPQPTSPTPSWLEIFVQSLLSSKEVELTSLVLGNLVGDDGAARNIFQAVSDDFKTSLVAGLIRSVSPATPTAAWTLTNMIRNDSVSYARTYCSETLLSAPLLMAWLREPSLVTQTAWIIASLTAREEQTVEYLCGMHYCKQEKESSFLSAIVQSIQNPLQPDQIVPLVQALGNLACHPSLVGPLLAQTTPNLIPLLQNILFTTSSRDPILIQGAWLAGCLLVDVGVENHPSTTVAAPALIPVLMERLGGGGRSEERISQFMTSMTLEEERECASALWNALDAPPSIDQQHVQHQPSLMNQHIRSPSFQLPFTLNVSRSTIQSLVRLINSNDSDAVLSGVHVINLLLRRENDHQYLQTVMQEEELPDALERVCDSPMEELAEVAADILDDFFYDEHQNDMGDAKSLPSWTNGPTSSITPTFGIDVENRDANGLGRGRGRGAMMPAWMTK
jgi:hypothetical protein